MKKKICVDLPDKRKRASLWWSVWLMVSFVVPSVDYWMIALYSLPSIVTVTSLPLCASSGNAGASVQDGKFQ